MTGFRTGTEDCGEVFAGTGCVPGTLPPLPLGVSGWAPGAGADTGTGSGATPGAPLVPGAMACWRTSSPAGACVGTAAAGGSATAGGTGATTAGGGAWMAVAGVETSGTVGVSSTSRAETSGRASCTGRPVE